MSKKLDKKQKKLKFIGDRIKKLRKEILVCNQSEFATILNEFDKNDTFRQAIITNIEQGISNKIDKLLIIINYFYEKHNINPNWLIMENNNTQSKTIFNIQIEKNIIDELNNAQQKINALINDMKIIVLNTNYNDYNDLPIEMIDEE